MLNGNIPMHRRLIQHYLVVVLLPLRILLRVLLQRVTQQLMDDVLAPAAPQLLGLNDFLHGHLANFACAF